MAYENIAHKFDWDDKLNEAVVIPEISCEGPVDQCLSS